MRREHTLPTVWMRGLRLHALKERQCIDHIMRSLDEGEGGWVVTPNLDFLRRWEREESFRTLLRDADLMVADGMPLVWASRLQGTPLPERVAGSSLIVTLSGEAARRGWSVFLLGGEPDPPPGAAADAHAALNRLFPALRTVGWHCPPFGFEDDLQEMATIERQLREARPDIVFVALGSPKQELLIRRIRHLLPQAWWLGVGVSFSFVSGRLRRAPLWMQRAGLEWTHRLVQQPHALLRRYLIQGIPYAIRLLTASALTRMQRRRACSANHGAYRNGGAG
jgi:N-acetylglucosaminyldiphosphoundecaprenol N-acetyl-beta-D-mannosaminyltransferase